MGLIKINFDVNKKGQQPISYFIMMIALLIVVYMILLPEAEKESLLYEGQSPDFSLPQTQNNYITNTPSIYSGGKNLLNVNPGVLSPEFEKISQKNFASVNLFLSEETEYEILANDIQLESTITASDMGEFVFNIDDLNNLENIKLLFFIISSRGDLTVKLNGIKILSGEVTNGMLPISLPNSMLQEFNRLTFEVEKPSFFEFMSSNYYSFKDIQLIKYSLTKNNYEARQFVLSSENLDNLNHMNLMYRLNCFSLQDSGRILVKLNGNIIHDALAVCDAGVTELDLLINDLIIGRNVLEFSVDKGQYVLENLILESDYSGGIYKRYYFVVQISDMENIMRGNDVVLQARFPNDGKRKAGTFYVNGYPIYFDTFHDEFVTNLNGLVYSGQNLISIVPEEEFEMVTFDVFIG